MRNKSPNAVLGFRPHTYWTAAVALAGPPDAPQVLGRRRIVFATGLERFVYHQAAKLDLAGARALIEEVRMATRANAGHEIGDFIADLTRDGLAVQDAMVPAGTARVPDALEDILRAHAYVHAAEGNFYRDVVAAACVALGLRVHRIAERNLASRLGHDLRLDDATLEARMKQMGAALGPPWNEDYRLAAQAAWIHLCRSER